MSAEEQKNMNIDEMDDRKRDFIKEQIAPKKKTKMKKFLVSLGTTSILAIAFGFISSIVFSASSIYFEEVFGKDGKPIISLTETEQSETNATEQTEKVTEPATQPVVEQVTETTKKENTIIKEQIPANLNDLRTMYSQLQERANVTNKSIVTVSSIQSGVDWFDNPVESTDASYGLLIANNGEQLLFLAGKSNIEDTSSLRVTFADGFTTEARLYASDKILDIAIVAVDVAQLSEATLSTVSIATLGETAQAPTGTLVLALGNPNGSMYSMEFGMVTSQPVRQYITDSDLELFDTDMTYNENGSGIVADLNGNVVGIISSKYDIDYSQNMSVVGISKLKPVIENLINQIDASYVGIVANDITTDYKNAMQIDGGIYITEVQGNSPALAAGLKSGDIIFSMGGNGIESVEHFHRLLLGYEPGTKVEIGVYHTALAENQEETLLLDLSAR